MHTILVPATGRAEWDADADAMLPGIKGGIPAAPAGEIDWELLRLHAEIHVTGNNAHTMATSRAPQMF